MRHRPPLSARMRTVLGTALLVAGLAACGGDLQVAGVSGGGTGAAASGTVTGFGSIIVDGKTWDDSAADVRIELDPTAAPAGTLARLGQRVDIEFQVDGQATRVAVRPTVIGAVSQVDVRAGITEFVALGQRVRVNADATVGPVTVFDGAAAAGALAGRIVEVHGTWLPDAATGRAVVQASRVTVRSTLQSGYAQLSGTVEGLNPVAGSFRIGDLPVTTGATTRLVGDERSLGNGQRVTVWSRQPLLAGPTLAADVVRIAATPASGVPTFRAGVVARYDRTAGRFVIDGITVDARAATLAPAGATLLDGAYVRVRGAFDGTGTLVARDITVRRPDTDVEVSLRGSIAAFVSTGRFTVRGVPVDAATATTDLSACPAGTTALRNGLLVRIEGRAQADGVHADRIRCEGEASGVTIELEGIVSTLDRTAQTFTVQGSSGSGGGGTARSVAWNDRTLFEPPLSAAALAPGARVSVEALVTPSGLVARSIEQN